MSDGTGTIADTYVAALQHDLAELPPETTLVGVVRRPTSWFHGAVDENVPALGPPASLLDEMNAAMERATERGIEDAAAHEDAWDAVEFGERYADYLESDDEARAAVEELLDRLESGEDVALVCYENTDEKRCHRTILREELTDRLGGT